jgi:hypothetical protein
MIDAFSINFAWKSWMGGIGIGMGDIDIGTGETLPVIQPLPLIHNAKILLYG